MLLQDDGKIVVVGHFFYIITGPGTSVQRSCIARFNNDGTLDPSFDPGSGFEQGYPTTTAAHLVRQNLGANSGNLIVQGNFSDYNGHGGHLVRLSAGGVFDNTFTPTSDYWFGIAGLFVQSDDQLLVFGDFYLFGDPMNYGIVRLDSSGARDSGFNAGTFADYGDSGTVSAVAGQADDQLIVAEYFHSLGGATANNAARLATNGSRDSSFGATAAGSSAYYVKTVLVRPSDGQIFLGGYFSTYDGEPRNNIAWANQDDSLAGAFSGLGGVTDFQPQIYALATQADGKVLVGGFFSS